METWSPEKRLETRPPKKLEVSVQVVNVPKFEEATLRRVVTPRIEIDPESRTISLISQGLTLSEAKRTEGVEALLLEVAARYRHGEGSIKQLYRYLVFSENGKLYCQRLPMGAWAPADPDLCLEWLGRGGLQQGDFILLPRKHLPSGAIEVERPTPKEMGLWSKGVEMVREFIGETLLDQEIHASEWERLIGRHDPVGCKAYRKENRVYLQADAATEVRHPEHSTLAIPAGTYEVVEDRASSYWRKAID
ncbi:MAG TPA: hypothetical protein V6C82_08660 [Chroococcales cyanobacterium]|jgi:hypothetical protein